MAFSLPFIKKVDDNEEKTHSTPIDVKELEKKAGSVDKEHKTEISKKESNTTSSKDDAPKNNSHVATVVYKPTLNFPKFDKYVLITVLSVIFCVSGLSFWLYVQFFISP